MTWATVALDTAAEVVRGVTFSKGDASETPGPGLVPVLRAGNIGEQLNTDEDLVFVDEGFISEKQRLRANDILVCMSSGSAKVLGKSAILEDEWPGSFGAFLATLRPRADILHPQFLAHYVRTPQFRTWASGSSGIGIKNIRASDLKSYEIPLPPLEEQKRIAGILDQADALRRLRARALDKLNTLGQAIFHEMFGDKSQTPTKSISEIAKVKGGKRLPKGSEYADLTTEHPYIRVSDLGHLRIDQSSMKYITEDIHRGISRYIVNTGDVIISIAGSIGITSAVPKSLNGANLTENAAKITPKSSGKFDATYLAWALSMPEAQAQISSRTGQVTIGKLALFRIEQIEVPMPSIEEQRQFSSRIEELEKQISSMKTISAKVDELFSSLQHRAFRGDI